MPKKIAINGFGRIGRAAFKIALDKPEIEVVAINDLTDTKTLAYLLKHDTVYGTYEKNVSFDETNIIVDGKKYQKTSEPDPTKLPWANLDVDVVLECTGRFVKDGAAKTHLVAGAKKVIVSAPTKGAEEAPIFLRGVNEESYLGQNLISNASCTTNNISPVIDIINQNFGVLKAGMTTIHAYTSTQNLVDGPHKDLRRARAAAANIIPTSTGAAIATTKVLPQLAGKFDGTSLRVPVTVGSISDITMLVKKKTSKEEVNKSIEDAAKSIKYKDIVEITYEPVVSSDIIKNPHSAIVDAEMTMVIDGDFVKVFAWYDNEWGYSNRLVELSLL